MKQRHRLLLRLQNIAFPIFFLGIIGLLAFLGQRYYWQGDWTQGQRNTLTDHTQTLLSNLKEPLNFVAYLPDNKGLQRRVRQLISKYQRTLPTIQLEFVNPDLNPLRAKQDGIDNVGQLVVQLGSRSEVVDSISEKAIANAIWRMSRGGKRLVVFLEGHDERSPIAENNQGLSRLTTILQRNGFLIQPHSLMRMASLPDNARFLVLASPQAVLLPAEVTILRDYIKKGGNLLWLQDPVAVTTLNLQPLADDLGVNWGEGAVVDANEELRAMLGINHPAVIPVVDYAKLPWVQALTGKQSLFPFATQVSYDATKTSDWRMETLLTTLPNSWLETGSLQQASLSFDPENGDIPGPVSIGLLLKRAVPATPVSLPQTPASALAITKSTETTADTERNSGMQPTQVMQTAEQRVVVIGDSDFMSNAFIGHGVNLDLATGLFNWLSADENVLGIVLNSPRDTRLTLSQPVMAGLALFFLAGLPLLLLACGGFLWWHRRRR